LVQVPIYFTMIRNGLHVLTRKLVTEVLFSSLATLLTMAILSNMTKPLLLFAQDSGRLASSEGGLAGGETKDVLGDFMQRAALAHVVGLKTPAAAASQATIVAASEPAAAAVIPLPPAPPRPAAAPRHDRPSSSKMHVAASIPKVLPPAPAPEPMQPPPATVEPAAVPVAAKAEPLPPIQYGMRLVANLGNIITASETRVVEGVASVGDTLNSLVKKL
jgi:hypothetical protein